MFLDDLLMTCYGMIIVNDLIMTCYGKGEVLCF